MADPRAGIAPSDVGLEFDTFLIDNSTITYSATTANGSAQAGVGLAVTLSADNTVALAADAEAIVGRLESVNSDLIATVAVRGKKLKFKGGTSATLTRGTKIVGDLLVAAKGYVRSSDGTAGENAKARGYILDDDATNPVVQFP